VSEPNSDDPGSRRSASVNFPARLYTLDTIKKAAYRFSDVAAIEILPDDDKVECRLHLLSQSADKQVEELVNNFRIEVLDQDLRASIAAETAPMRNAILAYAFSKTGMQGE
jgi:His-Xaa-Ser system protein HxsD